MKSKRTEAEELFTLWHERGHDRVAKKTCPPLSEETFTPIGKAIEIYYRSNKWEKDRSVSHLYVHGFATGPLVYVPTSRSSADEAIGKPVENISLVGDDRDNGALLLVELARAVSIEFEDSHKKKTTIELSKRAKMYSTIDKRSIVIIDRKEALVIKGGKMTVTKRGIVK